MVTEETRVFLLLLILSLVGILFILTNSRVTSNETSLSANGYNGNILAPEDTTYTNDYTGVIQPKDTFSPGAVEYFNIFKGLDFSTEFENKINGSPLDPLVEFRNPCWNASLTEQIFDASNSKAKWNMSPKVARVARELAMDYLSRGQAWRIRCIPHLLLIGFAKSGTSDLHYRINLHPEVFQSPQTEIFFWSRAIPKGSCPKRPQASISDYADFFDRPAKGISEYFTIDSNGNKFHPGITMEASSSTAFYHSNWECLPLNQGQPEPVLTIPQIIYSVNPAQVLLVTMRNPVDRLYSMYKMKSRTTKRNNNRTPEQFDTNVRHAIARWEACLTGNTVRGCAYNNSLIPHEIEGQLGITLRFGIYHIFLKDWLDVFPRDQIFFVKFEEYNTNIRRTLAEIFRFLGLVEPTEKEWSVIEGEQAQNPSPKASPMLPDTRSILEEFYKPFNQPLQQLIGDKFTW